MTQIDRQLANLQTEVELHGRSGADSIYLRDVQVTFLGKDYTLPQGMREAEVKADLDWFLSCADVGEVIPHPDPYHSFWLMQFGPDASPYGELWDLPYTLECLAIPEQGRRAVLINSMNGKDVPCVLSYQFHREGQKLHMTVNMRSSDVVGVLPFDVALSRRLLEIVADSIGCEAQDMTFNLGNAHVLWSDCIHGVDEFTADSDY
jgi:hypothetical protein